jgi:DNA-directed RNA polymerase specialized sigma subunit
MRRIIVDYAKLTHEILNLLVEKFPEGYYDSNIIRFRNAQNELIEAVEVQTEDTIYLVKVSTKLADRIENYDEDDEIADEIDTDEIDADEIETDVKPLEGLEIDDDDAVGDDDDDDDSYDKPDIDNGDDDDDDDEDNNTNESNFSDEDDDDED